MHQLKIRLLLFLVTSFLLGGSFNSWSQSVPVKHYTTNDGLPSSFVYRAIQDRNGYMWFCTDKGVTRYNGYDYRTFDVNDGLPSNIIWDIVEDKEGKGVWIATFADHPIQIYQDSIIHPIKSNDDLESFEKVAKLGYWQDRLVYSNSSDLTINYIERDTIFKLKVPEKGFEIFWSIISDEFQNVRLLAFKPLKLPKDSSLTELKKWKDDFDFQIFDASYYNNDLIFTPIKKPDGTNLIEDKKNVYRSKLLNINGQLYHKSEDGLTALKTKADSSKVKRLKDAYYQDDFLIYPLKDKVFFSHKTNSFITDQDLNHLAEFDFISQFEICRIYIDKDDNMWVCTYTDGVYMISQNAIKTRIFDNRHNLNDENITALHLDTYNNVWIGTNSMELYNLKDNKIERIKSPIISKQNGYIRDITSHDSLGVFINFYNNENQFVSNHKDLQSIQSNHFKSIVDDIFKKYIDDYNADLIKSAKEIYQNNDKILFSGKYGVAVIDIKKEEHFTIESDKIRIYSTDVELDSIDIYWMASKNGLSSYPKQFAESLNERYPEITSKALNIVRIDKHQRKWLGTDGYGAYVIIKDSIINIEATKGLIITDIFTDPYNDKVYLGSNKGLCIVDWPENGVFSTSFMKLANGLPSKEVLSITANADHVYIGTTKGLAVVEKCQFNPTQPSKPIISVEAIKINGKKVESENIYLNFKDKLKIEFLGIDYKSAPYITYQYRFYNHKTNQKEKNSWLSTIERSLSFYSLSKGSYFVDIKAIDVFGNSSDIESIHFHVKPPWWESWYFILSILMIGLILFYSRFKTLKKRNETELKYKKRLANMELQALQSQMNPHFVFNIMNSFQRIAMDEDFLKVNSYITSFSRLMRMVLDSSREKYITLDDEIVLLTEYLKLEQLRFKDKFEYQINVPEISTNLEFKLPTMMIQPFVENAVIHGVNLLQESGLIELSFKTFGNELIIVVEDNGVGLEKAHELSLQSIHKHKSRGMEIIYDRIEILKQNDLFDIQIEILDKTKENIGKGTKITIVIKAL